MTPAAQRQREQANVSHGLYATRSAATQRARKLRHRVAKLRREFPQLADKPRHLILRYAEVDFLAAAVWIALQEQGPTNEAGEPRRLLSEYRLLLDQLRSLADALGMLTPSDADPLSRLLQGGSR